VKLVDLQGREHTFELDKRFKVKRKDECRSISQWKLGRLLCKVYGRNNIFEDYPLPGSNNLSWDFWIPSMDIAFEFHGRQHDEYVRFFHGTKAGFERQKKADFRKSAIADANSITLVVIRDNDFQDWTVEELKEIITMELE